MSAADPLHVAEATVLGSETALVFHPERLAGVDPARYARRPLTVRVLLENLVRHYRPDRTDLAALVALANEYREAAILAGMSRVLPSPPRVVARRRDAERAALLGHCVRRLLRVDQRVLQLLSFAKKAAAFF